MRRNGTRCSRWTRIEERLDVLRITIEGSSAFSESLPRFCHPAVRTHHSLRISQHGPHYMPRSLYPFSSTLNPILRYRVHRRPVHPLRLIARHRLTHERLLGFHVYIATTISSTTRIIPTVRLRFRLCLSQAADQPNDTGYTTRFLEDAAVIDRLPMELAAFACWIEV